MSKHMLAPWVAASPAPGIIDIMSSEGAVCRLYTEQAINKSKPTMQNAYANARLIVAAPEMVDLLEAALDSQDCNGYLGCKVEDEIRALLARIEGQE